MVWRAVPDAKKCGTDDLCEEDFCRECRSMSYCNICEQTICQSCRRVSVHCRNCDFAVCETCLWQDASIDTSIFAMCSLCEGVACSSCLQNPKVECFQRCRFCEVRLCAQCTEDYYGEHVCTSPGEQVYSARNAKDGDDPSKLCSCGKKCLHLRKGQQFMCGWLQK